MSAEPATPREQYEERQRTWLAPYAVREADSGGRKYLQDEHPYRTCFHRDRDRVVHSAAFRRLDFKTQVFVPHEHDHYRTRLTHTLEVAQIARALGRALRLNEDLIEAVALAHDLGHPPFGHAGEGVLDELMAGQGHFEHNRQSLRVVDYLEHPYPAFRGLNLTRAVRECIALHRTRYDTPLCDDFDASLQPPLEGQIVDAADEIAYTSADLEDSLAAEWITLDQIAHMDLWRRAWATAERETPDARPIHKRIRACKAVLATLADDLIETTSRNLSSPGAMPLRVLAEGHVPDSTCLSPRTGKGMAPGAFATTDAIRHAGKRLVTFSPSVEESLRPLQEFLLRDVYLGPRAIEKDRQARTVITGLFQTYVSDPSLLPERYRLRIDSDGLHRTVCDYIAGMTDRYAIQEHERLHRS